MADPRNSAEPIINLPQVMIGLIAFLITIHAATLTLLNPSAQITLITVLSFIPVRFSEFQAVAEVYPMGGWPVLWSPFTYGLLHASWEHLFMNMAWLVAFGTPVARRFGSWRFLLFTALGTAAGAGLFFVFHMHAEAPLVGASAGISALMAGATRFIFLEPARGSRMGQNAMVPAPGLLTIFRHKRTMTFVGLWLVMNLAFAFIMPVLFGQEGAQLAWEAHLGGFIFGFFGFSLFDPIRPAAKVPSDPL